MSNETILSRFGSNEPVVKHDDSPPPHVDGENDTKDHANESTPPKAGSTQSLDKVPQGISSEKVPEEEEPSPPSPPAEELPEEKVVEEEIKPEEKKPPPLCFKSCPKFYAVIDNYKGIVLGILTAVFLSLATYLAQQLSARNGRNYSALLTCAWRFAGVFVTSLPLLGYYQCFKKQKIWKIICPLCTCGPSANGRGRGIMDNGDKQKTTFFLFIRCLVGTLSFFTQFYAILYIPLGDASAIIFSNVVVVVFFAWCCLKEECGVVPTIAACLTVLGVIIVVRPPFIFKSEGSQIDETKKLNGYLLAISSLFLNALSYVSLRFLREIHFSVMAFSYGLFGLLCSIIVGAAFGVLVLPADRTATLLFFGLAFLSALGQMTLTLAMKYEAAAIVSTLRATDVCFSFIWQVLLEKERATAFSIGGASLIMFCIILLGFRKWLSELKDTHPWKKTLWFILK